MRPPCVPCTNFFCVRIRCRGNVFTEPLPSNDNLFWLHYSGFQASVWIYVMSHFIQKTLCFLCNPRHIKYSICSKGKAVDLLFPELLQGQCKVEFVYVCGGEGQLVSEDPFESPPIEGQWPVVVRSLVSPKGRPHFEMRKSLRKNKNIVMGPDGTWKQDWLCWRSQQ
jgi:hypothetical protein